jgi:hypothetical protein
MKTAPIGRRSRPAIRNPAGGLGGLSVEDRRLAAVPAAWVYRRRGLAPSSVHGQEMTQLIVGDNSWSACKFNTRR